jgi:hypothetical protein
MSRAIATAIGKTYGLGSAVTIASATKISPVAYETDDRASEAKTGRARTFGRRVCSRR